MAFERISIDHEKMGGLPGVGLHFPRGWSSRVQMWYRRAPGRGDERCVVYPARGRLQCDQRFVASTRRTAAASYPLIRSTCVVRLGGVRGGGMGRSLRGARRAARDHSG